MAKKIWVVAQQREGKLHRMSQEAVAAGQKLASAIGGEVEVIVLGASIDSVAEQLSGFSVSAVHTASSPALAAYTPGAFVGVLAPAIRAAAPDFVLFPHTYQSVDFVPRLAQATESGLIPEVTAFEVGADGLTWSRPILGGKMSARVRDRGEGTLLVSVQSGAFSTDDAAPASGGSAPVRVLDFDPASIRPDREILGVEEAAADQVDLTKADAIVAVGRGVGGEDKMQPIRDLAAVLGAEIGASRPVIDSGWLPRDRQIGSSGQTVTPKLYIAAGISGAIQHTVGMKGATTIVAINKDKSAPIFAIADYGLIGDLHEILPALTAAIRAVKEG